MKKQILIKVYNSSGNYLDVWNNASFVSFTKEINAGLGECVIELPRLFDASGTDLILGNIVDIMVSDKESVALATEPSTKKIYSGYISMIEPVVGEKEEKIIIHLLGHYTKLALDILKDSTTTTINTHNTTGVGTAAVAVADIGLVMRGIIDRYRAENTNPQVNYTSTTIPLVGSDMKYTFEQKTYREAIDKVLSASVSGYYYFINENGVMTFKSKSTTATHKFIFGKHFSSINIQRSLEKVKNFFLVWDGQAAGTYKHYQDDTSISLYGRRAERLVDTGIKDSTTADLIGNKFIAENKVPDIKIECDILDNSNETNKGYDIESINPGDTCSFYNFDSSLSDILQENMLITKVTYYVDRVHLTIELVRSGLIDIQRYIAKNVAELKTEGTPTTYT